MPCPSSGFLIDVILVPVIVGLVWLLGPWVLGIQLSVLPSWAQ